MKKIGMAFAIIMSTVMGAFAQTSLTGGFYSQNFNSLGTSSTAAVPAGWKVFMNVATPNYASGTTNTTQAVTGTAASNASYGIYNFGPSSADRGLGFISSSNANWGSKAGNIEFALTNNSAATFSSINLSWDYELFRSAASRDFEWNFYYSTNGTTWTAFAAGDQSYPAGTTTASITKSFALAGIEVPKGSSLYFRWEYTTSGAWTSSPGLGIDNFQFTAVPEPHEYGIALAGMLIALVVIRRRHVSVIA